MKHVRLLLSVQYHNYTCMGLVFTYMYAQAAPALKSAPDVGMSMCPSDLAEANKHKELCRG